jgi:hypothetical protein
LPIGLKRRLQLDDETLDDLIYAKKLAVDEDDRMLVWTGGTAGASPPPAPLPQPRRLQAERTPAAPPPPEVVDTLFDHFCCVRAYKSIGLLR